MPAIAVRNKTNDITEVKKMKDYSDEPAFKKKAEKALNFLKKNGAPKTFTKKKK